MFYSFVISPVGFIEISRPRLSAAWASRSFQRPPSGRMYPPGLLQILDKPSLTDPQYIPRQSAVLKIRYFANNLTVPSTGMSSDSGEISDTPNINDFVSNIFQSATMISSNHDSLFRYIVRLCNSSY